MKTIQKLPVIFLCSILLFQLLFLIKYMSYYEQRNDILSNVKKHQLCVIIPYRNRWNELQEMAPQLNKFLRCQRLNNSFIIVLNQTDNLRFNRASLINVGWFEADRLGCDYIAMHDVDIIPLNKELDYGYPGKGYIRHISSGKYHPIKRYDYPTFIGGVLLMTLDDFRTVNGMSNKYWGWGLEDDEFFLRLRDGNLAQNILRPMNLSTDRSSTFKHIHNKHRKRDYALIGNQKKMSRRRDRNSGLNTVKYTIVSRSLLDLNGTKVSMLHVSLKCDKYWTPYCEFPKQSPN